MSSQSLFFVGVVAVALCNAGCGKKEAVAPAAETAAASTAPAPAANAPAAGPRVVEIMANDAMKFSVNRPGAKVGDPVRLEARAGESLRVVLNNAGSLPKEAMGHNFVLLKAGTNVEEFAAAAIAAGPGKNYFPPDRADQTLAHTPLIGPKSKAEASFTAPSEPGEYVFLCTFPGHFAAGMKGVLVVQ